MNISIQATIFLGLLIIGGTGRSQGAVYSVLSPINPPEGLYDPIMIGLIEGVPDARIHLLELGVGGDADSQSGPVLFSVLGSGLSFSWSAGQQDAGATYTLGSTPTTGVFTRGFVYLSVSEWADAGSSVAIYWHGNLDPDGFRTSAFDSQGNYFDDEAGTARAWLRYQVVPVPEPATSLLILCGAFVFAAVRRRDNPLGF